MYNILNSQSAQEFLYSFYIITNKFSQRHIRYRTRVITYTYEIQNSHFTLCLQSDMKNQTLKFLKHKANCALSTDVFLILKSLIKLGVSFNCSFRFCFDSPSFSTLKKYFLKIDFFHRS